MNASGFITQCPPWVIGAAIFIAIGLAYALFAHQLLARRYFRRSCGGRAWRKSFPHASKEDIRQFLQVFVDAFGFREKHGLKFLPSDKLMDIYKARYPLKGMADGMELETLAMSLEEKYGCDMTSLWTSEITLGTIFQHVMRDAGSVRESREGAN